MLAEKTVRFFSQIFASPCPAPIAEQPPIFNVPRTSKNVLDFSPLSNTPESKTMLALLSQEPENNTIALVGMGGAGKTTILKALGRHSAIWNVFKDAIWFVELGHDVTLQAFLDSLKELVQDALPDFLEKFVNLAASGRTHIRMINELLDRLENMNFLLILDDVWHSVPSVVILVRTVCEAVQEMDSASLKVLTSTRDWGVAAKPMHSCSIDTNPVISNVETAHRILFYHAGTELLSVDSLSDEDRNALDHIVKMCAGLPLALSLAGSSICQIEAPLGAVDGRVKHGRFARFWEYLEGNIQELENSDIVGEKGLFASIQLSVQMMEEKWKVEKITIERMFRSLSMLMKQSMMPIPALEKLWGLDGKSVKRGIVTMHRYNIVSTVTDDMDRIIGLRMHDLVHDVSIELAERTGGVHVWHDRLIGGYIESGEVEEFDERRVGWWKLKKEDEYMRENVVHHLLGAGRGREALELLTDYRWIEDVNGDEKRVAFQKVMSDMEGLKKYVEKLRDVELVNTLLRDIDVVVRTMNLCMVPYCIQNRNECTFQLLCRLESLCSDSDVVKRLLWSVEKYARRPWVRGRKGMLRCSKGRLRHVIPLKNGLNRMEQGVGSDEVVVWGSGDAVVMNTDDGSRIFGFGKCEMDVRGVCIDMEQERIYLCGVDGAIDVWRKKERLCTFQFSDMEEDESIECAHLLQKRKVIVGGSSRGRLLVMDVSTGETMKTVEGHKNKIVQAVRSGNVGDAMISLCGETLQVRDTSEFKVRWERSLERDEVMDMDDEPFCIAISGNERMIAIGSRSAPFYLWDAEKGKDICEFNEHGNPVLSFAFSKDDKLLYSGSYNEFLLWDVSNIENDGVKFLDYCRHSPLRWVRSLIVSTDNSKLFARGEYEMFVWDVGGPHEKYMVECTKGTIFLDEANFSGISPDDKTIVTINYKTKMIEMRNLCDVPDRTENFIANIEFGLGFCFTAVAVSNDQRLFGYSLYRPNVDYCCIVEVMDFENRTVLHSFCELNAWVEIVSKELDSRTALSSVTRISFTPSGFITAEAYVKDRKKKYTVEISWNLSTKEYSFRRPSLPLASSDSSPQLVCIQSDYLPLESRRTVQLRQGSDSSIVATLEHDLNQFHYIPTTSRLWLSRYLGGLDYIELITEETELPHSEQPPLPLLPEAPSLEHPPDESKPVYDFFISHAGPDKMTIAKLLCDALTDLGLSVFLDKDELHPGQDAPKKMNRAMKTAKIAIVILSPEFAARKWTMKELKCFLDRHNAGGERDMLIIPVFYRLTVIECRIGVSIQLLTRIDESGNNIFRQERFFERVAENPMLIREMVDALESLAAITGIENTGGMNEGEVTNRPEDEEKRKVFVGTIVDAVMKAKVRLDRGDVDGVSDDDK